MSAEGRGSGFVHLNTPASISYTAGHTLSVSDLRRKKSRAECVVMPNAVSAWRRAANRYTGYAGYLPFATDTEDERAGSGVLIPPISGQRYAQRGGASSLFFLGRHVSPGAATTAAASLTSSAQQSPLQAAAVAREDKEGLGEAQASQTGLCLPPPATREGGEGHGTVSSTLTTTTMTANGVVSRTASSSSAATGITIVSHHKVTGVNAFVYPDYDGVMSHGVVPEVIVTAEEKAEQEAQKKHYVSPLTMTNEELAAFEELQALWKSRARSHSVLGAQHRAAAGGSLAPGDTDVEGEGREETTSHPRRKLPRVESSAAATGHTTAVDTSNWEDEMTGGEGIGDETDQVLAEALLMADDLLRFA